MPEGRPIDAKLFLEGREVPFIGATFTHTVNQASVCYIEMVPVFDCKHIKPRTMVHLFVKDFSNRPAGFPYVLAWEGEVFGYTYQRQTASRGFTLKCIDYSSYWDNVLAYFFNAQQSLSKGATNIAPRALNENDAARAGITQKAVTHSIESYFIKIMTEAINKNGEDTLNALTAVIKNITNINTFYEYAEDRLRINDRIFLRSSASLTELLKESEALKWYEGLIGTQTGYSTLRSVIQTLLGVIFHDMVTVPFPSRTENPDLSGERLPNPAAKNYSINNFIFKPTLYMIAPPVCNIFFPDEYSMVNYDRNFFHEPTRLIYKPTLPTRQGSGTTVLPHSYQPESFNHFMEGVEAKQNPGQFEGEGDLDIRKTLDSEGNEIGFNVDPAFFQSEDQQKSSVSNQNRRREGQFMTNEERMKGILLSQENQIPSSTAFRASLKDDLSDFADNVSKYLFYKKRFEPRSLQITSHMKLSVVPGMTVLLLDDSAESMNMVAFCSSVTHRITVGQGGFTQVTLSYARTVDEQENATTSGNSPPIPKWYEEEIFGKVDQAESECNPRLAESLGKTYVGGEQLNDFYKDLLGDLGSKAITSYYKNENTLIGSVCRMLREYRSVKRDTTQSVLDHISRITRRDYVLMRDTFTFLGAESGTLNLENTENLINFTGDRINGENTGDSPEIKQRQDIVKRIQKELNEKRGFRG